MGKRKKNQLSPQQQQRQQKQGASNGLKSNQPSRIHQFVHGRRLKAADKEIFEKRRRHYECLFTSIEDSLRVIKLDDGFIRESLALECSTIEDQIILLRDITRMTYRDFMRRRHLVEKFLNCLLRHHGVIYQGLIFGSSINGLGFRDSDIDLRLRPLMDIGDGILEPYEMPRALAEDTLRNIAFQTTKCSPALGHFVPSRRCPIAKLTFLSGQPPIIQSYREEIECDVSLLSTNSLGSYNSMYIRFLCHLEPKFHLLATVLRYWSKAQKLIQPGYLSSYALVNMLIFFCQNLRPRLLPTVDQMRKVYLKQEDKKTENGEGSESSASKLKKTLTRQEWDCLVCLKKECYPVLGNHEPLSLLLLKFFEFYLKYPYSSKTIMNTRTGKALDLIQFQQSRSYDPDFPIKVYLNIQDPFDLKHNLTSGIDGEFFRKLILKIRLSYETLCQELTSNFKQPHELNDPIAMEIDEKRRRRSASISKDDLKRWGLNAIFCDLVETQTEQ